MKICFVAGLPSQSKGGAEVQCELIAKHLADKNYEVHYVAPPIGEIKTDERFIIHKIPKRFVKIGNTLSYLPDLYLQLKKANCDIYIQTCAGSFTGVVGYFCKKYHKKFIYRSSHVWDADLSFKEHTGWYTFSFITKITYKHGIIKSDAIVCNSRIASKRFRKNIDKRIETIYNGQIIPLKKKIQKKNYVLWAGRLTWYKHPELFLELAKALPNYRFVMCGGGPLEGQILTLSQNISNLDFKGFITEKKIRKLYGGASAFVSTSESEGFPNTLIECGLCGTPYICFYDPDEVVCRYNLGAHVKNLQEMISVIPEVISHHGLRRNIRNYVERFHNIRTTAVKYEKLMLELLQVE